MDSDEIARRFDHHPPTTDATRTAHERARATVRQAAEQLAELLPEGREKALAITRLEEALFWANAAIARA